MNVRSVVVEVTRRCNYRCRHCLRGGAQRKDLNLDYVDELFCGINTIGNITLSGGEPFLKPEIMLGVLERARWNDVVVDNFYIATNGSIRKESTLDVIQRWSWYCRDNDISGVKISTDTYHQEFWRPGQRWAMQEFFEETDFEYQMDNRQQRECLSGIIREGRAAQFGGREVHPEEIEFEFWDGEPTLEEPTVYLNVKGEIILCCDLSYISQKKNVFCRVGDFSSISNRLADEQWSSKNKTAVGE